MPDCLQMAAALPAGQTVHVYANLELNKTEHKAVAIQELNTVLVQRCEAQNAM